MIHTTPAWGGRAGCLVTPVALRGSVYITFSNDKTAKMENNSGVAKGQGKRSGRGQVQIHRDSNRDFCYGEGAVMQLDCGSGCMSL